MLRRVEWIPGVAVLGATVGIGAMLGLSAGPGAWPLYVVVIAAALLLIGWGERIRGRRREGAKPRPKARLRVIRGGKAEPYDLANDDSTDDQRYLM